MRLKLFVLCRSSFHFNVVSPGISCVDVDGSSGVGNWLHRRNHWRYWYCLIHLIFPMAKVLYFFRSRLPYPIPIQRRFRAVCEVHYCHYCSLPFLASFLCGDETVRTRSITILRIIGLEAPAVLCSVPVSKQGLRSNVTNKEAYDGRNFGLSYVVLFSNLTIASSPLPLLHHRQSCRFSR